MSKWKIWKRISERPQRRLPMARLCQCGGIKTRQTTLHEFFDLTSDRQTRLPGYKPPQQRVGMHSRPRDYRGSL